MSIACHILQRPDNKYGSGTPRKFSLYFRLKTLGAWGAAFALLLLCGVASAQTWPAKPIRMIIPFSPGGVSDILGRFWADKLSKTLNVSVVAENRPGAGTTIASAAVAGSAPDGYTLYFTDVTTHAINATLYKNLRYDTVKDFTDIAMVAAAPLVLVVPAKSSANSLQEFIDTAKQKPGELNYASSGNGTILHLAAEALKSAAGIKLTHIPYKGSTEATMATLSGQTSVNFSPIAPVVEHLKAGTLKALGVTSLAKNSALPQTAPIATTIPSFEIILYSGILGPANIPKDIVERVNAAVAQGMDDDDTKKLYASIGADRITMSPSEFNRVFSDLTKNMGRLVKESGAQVN